MKHACAKFRVFLLDQRGTGLSDAITTSGLLRQGDAAAQAEYLSHFRCPSGRPTLSQLAILVSTCACHSSSLVRPMPLGTGVQAGRPVRDIYCLCRRADNIIRDAEVVRKAMCQDTGTSGLWTLLGQSFGGFCAVSSHLLLPAITACT